MYAGTIGEALQRASFYLEEARIERARDEAEILLAHCLGWERLKLILERNSPLPDRIESAYFSVIKRRCLGEPVAYIIGAKEFYGLSFAVNRHVLVPRPETEFVVDAALKWTHDQGNLFGEGIKGLDLGTGSGNLAVTLAYRLPRGCFWATDLCPHALAVAAQNGSRHDTDDRITWLQGNYFQAFAGVSPPPRFNLIVANPPYISREDLDSLPETVKGYEPMLALDGGEDGLDCYRTLLAGLQRHIFASGLVALEIGAGQDGDVYQLLRELSLFHTISFKNDYQGRPRVIMGLF